MVVPSTHEAVGLAGLRTLVKNHHGIFRPRLRPGHRGLHNGNLHRSGFDELSVFAGKVGPAFRHLDKGRAVSVIGAKARLIDIIEKCEQPVEIFLLDRIVLVVMATRAGQGQAQEHRPHRFNPIRNVFNDPLIRNGAPLGVDPVVAIESRSDLGKEITIRNQVSRHLLDDETIKRHVVIQGANQPVAPDPHIAQAVILVAIGVGVARSLQPIKPHVFAIARR